MASVIADTGKAIYNNRLKGSGTEPAHLAWGTGAGTAAVTDTTLFAEAPEARVTGTTSLVTTTTTNDTFQATGTLIVAGSGKTITNVGLFDAATDGNLFLKSDFTGIALEVDEGINFTLKAVLS